MFVGEGKHARDVYPYYVSSLKKGGWESGWLGNVCVVWWDRECRAQALPSASRDAINNVDSLAL